MLRLTPFIALLGLSCGTEVMMLGPAENEDVAGDRAVPMSAPAPAMDAVEELQVTEGSSRAREKRSSFADDAPTDGESGSSSGASDSAEPARTRAWFPETFLWQPIVETGPDGTAQVPVRVPDRLTTWRVLGLAHTEGGQQGGAVHSFATVQEVYVDPVLPDHLHVGDRLELPVQVVNTGGDTQDVALDVKASAALTGGGAARLRLLPGGTVLRSLPVEASLAGQGLVEARLGSLDRVVRPLLVRPVGKPHVAVAGGSLTEARAFTLAGPAGADPATQELIVDVYPGALAVLQAELERLGSGAVPADPAYGFAVTSTLGRLAAASGAEIDPEAVRRVRQQSWQRLIREAGFDPSADRLPGLVGALSAVEAHELAVERRELWAQQLVDAQRADGTWAPSESGTIQALVVTTAASAWVLPDDEAYGTARTRASGALERLARQVEDPYTAAVVVGSGLVGGDLRRGLQQQVLDAVVERSDGSRTLPDPGRVKGALGRASRAGLLAWARLALEDRDDLVWRDDLVAELMAGYGPAGFGAGREDLVALAAVEQALPGVSEPVDVVLRLDDSEVARGRLDPGQPREAVRLVVAPGAEDPRYSLAVEGDAPGLAWTARLRSFTPWTEPADTGVEASWRPGAQRVGRIGTATLTISAPGGSRVQVRAGLPAGTWVDVDGLRDHPAVTSVERGEDHLGLSLRELGPAEILEIPVAVQPSFAGSFATGPLSLEIRGPRAFDLDLPPSRWSVRP